MLSNGQSAEKINTSYGETNTNTATEHVSDRYLSCFLYLLKMGAKSNDFANCVESEATGISTTREATSTGDGICCSFTAWVIMSSPANTLGVRRISLFM